jgi:hypothetical protein
LMFKLGLQLLREYTLDYRSNSFISEEAFYKFFLLLWFKLTQIYAA